MSKEPEKEDAAAFWGFDGAVARFLSVNPLGFVDPTYSDGERANSLAACELLARVLPLEQAITATPEQAVSLVKLVDKTSLLALHERKHMKDVLTGTMGAALVQAAAELTQGRMEAFRRMTRISTKVGRISWPIATYLPFLWDRHTQMFLKPEVAQDFARRVGHPFAEVYDDDLSATVYESFLKLAARTQRVITKLKPQDRIDIHGFMWAVGKHPDDNYRMKIASSSGSFSAAAVKRPSAQ